MRARRKGQAAAWQGEFHGEIVGPLPWKGTEGAGAAGVGDGEVRGEFVLTPISLALPGKAAGLTLSGTATRAGVTLRVVGAATEAQVAALRGMAPPLGDGVERVLGSGGAAERVMRIDVTCSRAWGAGQTCAEGAPVVAKRRRRR